MKKFLVISILIIPFFLFGIVEETASLKDFIFGNTQTTEYDNYLSHVSEGIASNNYNLYSPWDRQTNGFGTYHLPSATEQDQWQEITIAFTSQDYSVAENLIAQYGFPYEVVLFHDTDTNRNYYMLREQLDMQYFDDNGTENTADDELGSFSYGWGLYIFSPESQRPIVITTPHVNDDFTTGAVAVKCFEDWDARFLLMSGAGREVLWTNVSPYYNSKSLSDASRIETHPLNIGYKKACDEIRANFGRRELSFQIHGYDWNRHEGHTSCQISAGNGNDHPDLPIRDLSNEHSDLINNTSYIVHPENSIGFNAEETISDFYSVNYSQDDFYYYQSEDDSLEISNEIDLPGYSQNKQMQYSCYGWNDYDNFDPFFHIEMDELPNCYPQTISNYYWFYGYNPQTEIFDMNHLFDNTFAFYSPWIDATTETLNYYYNYSDQNPPLDIANLSINFTNYNLINLKWDRTSDYDFDSYQILYSTQPIEENNYSIFDRESDDILATQTTLSSSVTELEPNQEYYFKIRGKDKNGHYSALSNEVSDFTGVVNVTNFTATGLDQKVELRWYASHKDFLAGFNVERKDGPNEDFQQISSYLNNPDLLPDASGSYYIFNDENLEQNHLYKYRLSAVSTFGEEFIINNEKSAEPQHIFIVEVKNQSGDVADTVYFGKNIFATDGTDQRFDIVNNSNYPAPYIKARFVTAFNNNNAVRYIRQIDGEFDTIHQLKEWLFTISTSLTQQPLEITLLNPDRDAERLYLKRNNEIINLQENSYSYTPVSTSAYNFSIFWGNYIPQITFSSFSNKIYQPGEACSINWNTSLESLISSFDIYANNEENEIMIANLLPNDTNNYTWTIPEIYGDNYHFEIRAHLVDGDLQSCVSDDKFGIISPEYVFSGNSGWSLFSDPIIQQSYLPSEILGDEGEVYSFFNNNFYNVNEINANLPYFIYTNDDFNVQVNGDFERISQNVELSIGWNFVSNYHPINFNISQFRFIHNGIIYSFIEAVQSHLILPKCYDYNSQFYKIENILSGKSFWIYSFVEDLTLIMNPYEDNSLVVDFENNNGWDLNLNINWDTLNKTTLTLKSSNEFSDDYDFGYDIVRFPPKPQNAGNIAYFVSELETPVSGELSSIAKPLLSDSEEDEFDLPFHIAIQDSVHNFTVNLSGLNFPDNYNVILESDSLSLNLSENETEIVQNTIDKDYVLRITNQFVANDNNVNSAKFVTKNYPNPFSPNNSKNRAGTGTNIMFSLTSSEKINLTIYNIRGQKIKQLLSDNDGIFNKGKHIVHWNGLNKNNRAVSSGVYFYKIKAGKKIAVRKILLLK